MPADVLRLFVFARHAESAANAANMLNSNPSQPVALTARGRTQARALGAQLASLHVDLAVGTRLLRAWQTIDIALDGRQVPTLIEPGFDEIRAGDLDGAPIEAYRSWQDQHTPGDRLPHGESIQEALRRYARAAPPPGQDRNGHACGHPRSRVALYRGGRRNQFVALERYGLPARGSVSLRRARRPARCGQPGCVDIVCAVPV
jgi:bisphosphoglycerate-dependent phosphoglycerate mutase